MGERGRKVDEGHCESPDLLITIFGVTILVVAKHRLLLLNVGKIYIKRTTFNLFGYI